MFGQLFKGFQLLHAVVLFASAVGFFIFWARTRFWLPKYAHALAAVGLVVGVWCAANLPADAPINKRGPIAKILLALIVPTIGYFFFVFYGGQKAAFRHRSKTATEMADLIERFLNGASLYPKEWNDFVECSHLDARLDSYRKRCYELDPLVNCPDPQDDKALSELRNMVAELRQLGTLS